MLSKEEILRQVVPNNCFWEDNFDNVPRHYIETAMGKYAEQLATEFAELVAYYYEPMGGKPPGVIFQHVDGPAKYNIAELYTLFLTHKSNV